MIYSTAGEAVTRRVQQFRSKSSTVKSIWYWWRIGDYLKKIPTGSGGIAGIEEKSEDCAVFILGER